MLLAHAVTNYVHTAMWVNPIINPHYVTQQVAIPWSREFYCEHKHTVLSFHDR